MSPPSVQACLDRKQDNFLLLRFIAAAMVIYGHSFPITGGSGFPELFKALGWGTYSGSIAVDIFFVTSGFMVTGSYVRNPNPFTFALARFLRIVPAYFVCVSLCALLLGAIYTTLPLADYYAHPETWSYITNNMSFGPGLQWKLPDVFTDNPKRSSVNGSLWTLPAEVRMYLWVLGFGIFGLLARRWLGNICLLLAGLIGVLAPEQLPGFPISEWLRLAGLFLIGSFVYLNRAVLPVSGRLFLAVAVATWLLRPTAAYPPMLALSEALFVFWFAYRTRWYGFNRFGDCSYGLYLWGFPTQQAIAHHAPDLSPMVHTAIALPIAIVLGAASWKLVEKPALRLRHYRPWLRKRAEPGLAEVAPPA